MTIAYVCSPFRSTEKQSKETHIQYAKLCLLDAIMSRSARNGHFSPICTHLLYPQVLNDDDMSDRAVAKLMCRRLLNHARVLMVYTDYGVSKGMMDEIAIFSALNDRNIIFCNLEERYDLKALVKLECPSAMEMENVRYSTDEEPMGTHD